YYLEKLHPHLRVLRAGNSPIMRNQIIIDQQIKWGDWNPIVYNLARIVTIVIDQPIQHGSSSLNECILTHQLLDMTCHHPPKRSEYLHGNNSGRFLQAAETV